MSERKIVVVGDVMLDKYTRVRTAGVSKENSAVVVAKEESVDFNLGGAANVARCVHALGGDVKLLGFNSDKRVESLVNFGYYFDRPTHGCTPVKNRIVTRDGHYLLRLDEECTFFGRPDDWWKQGGESLGASFKSLIFAGRDVPPPVVCLVDYDKGCLTRAAAKSLLFHVDMVHESFKFPVIVDPGRHGLWDKFGTPRTIFRANLYQAMQLYRHIREVRGGTGCPPYLPDFDPGVVHDDAKYIDIADITARNLKQAGIEFAHLVLTLGPGGLAACSAKGKDEYAIVRGVKTPVTDTCGAGDVVTATMAVILGDAENPLAWDGLTAALSAASRAATIAVRMPGVYAVTREDMGWYTKTDRTPRPTSTD